MPEDIREKVISYIKKIGPILPVQISKHIERDLLLSGAILSELIARKQLRVSNASIGSSPVYYLPGQEYMLGPKLYNYLKSKEREAYDLLRENKLIKDEKLEPWQRIAFKQLKDFAIPLYVTVKDKTDIFWRFYLISEEEAKKLISDILQPKKQEKLKEQTAEQIRLTEVEQPEAQIKPEIIQKIEEPVQITEQKEKQIIKKPRKQAHKKEITDFYDLIVKYLNETNIKILEEKTIRKNKEYEFLAEFSSVVGNLKYFIKAKNKKSINDSEITLAYSQSQEKRTPCLLLTNGNLTKKAKELIEKKLSGQFVFKQI